MGLQGLPAVVCLVVAFGFCTTAHAWTATHDICAAGGDGGDSGGGANATGSGSAAIGGAGNGAAGGNGSGNGGVDAGGDPSGATSLQDAARPYSLRAIYFR